MEGHLEFEVYGLILYLAFLFAKIRYDRQATISGDSPLFWNDFGLNGGRYVSGFIQKVETVVF